MTTGKTGKRALGGVLALIATALLSESAWSKPGGGGGTTLNLQGVVAFGVGVSDATRGTYTISPGGSGIVQLTSEIYPRDVSLGDARFSLDGTRIAWMEIETSSVPVVRRFHLSEVVRGAAGDVVGLGTTVEVFSTTGLVYGFDLSRDASRMVIAMSGDLWLVRLSDAWATPLTSTAGVEKYPRWSPVDDRIAYTRYDVSGSAIGHLLTIDGNSLVTRTVMTGTSNFYAHEFACWAPDGGNLLFRGHQKNLGSDLYQVPSASSGSAINVTSGLGLQEHTPSWGW
jgi:hypothetical protein